MNFHSNSKSKKPDLICSLLLHKIVSNKNLGPSSFFLARLLKVAEHSPSYYYLQNNSALVEVAVEVARIDRFYFL